MYAKGTCLFCDTATTDDAIENAREYIRKNGLTSDDVKIVRTDFSIEVWTKREGVELK